jgi:hypothetical protein
MMDAALRQDRAVQRTIARRVLAGETLWAVATDYDIGASDVMRLVHVVCQHDNPDVYCEALKAALKRAPDCWAVKPSLTFLREHRAAFEGTP